VRFLALLLLLPVTVFGCDSSNDYEDCGYSATFSEPGAGRARCPGSLYLKEEARSREIFGTAFKGEAFAGGAVIRMDPRPPPMASASSYFPETVTTDQGGFYRVRNVPFAYDLTMRFENDIVALRDLSLRYAEPTVPVRTLPQTWTSTVELVLVPPPRVGSVITIVGGDGVVKVNVEGLSRAIVATKEFATLTKLHVIEHPGGTGIDQALSYGNVEVNVQAGTTSTAQLALTPIDGYEDLTLAASVPNGFALDGDIEVLLEVAGLPSLVHFASTTSGRAFKLPIFRIPNFIHARARARAGEAISDSGLFRLPERTGSFVFPLPVPPTVEAAQGGPELVAALGEGVLEHVLRPAAGTSGPTIHIVTKAREEKPPALETFGFPRLRGKWIWTVRDFPKVDRVERLYHPDWFLLPNATAAPVELTFAPPVP